VPDALLFVGSLSVAVNSEPESESSALPVADDIVVL
jgi:hypothetical protein